MEKQPRYVLMLSLEQMALRRLAVAMYSEPGVLASFAKFPFCRTIRCRNIRDASDDFYLDSKNTEWRQILEDKMFKLQLPKSLKKEMKPLLIAVGEELFRWKSVHQEYFSYSDRSECAFFDKLFWSAAGTVDYRKTAEEIARCDAVHIVDRFELACLYCLEDLVPVLWKELPEDFQESYHEEGIDVTSGVELQLFLPHVLRKLSIHPDFTDEPLDCFEQSASRGHKTLAEYFFRKLTKEERDASLTETAMDAMDRFARFHRDFWCPRLSDTLCYLLSLMTPAEQMGIFERMPLEVLQCFLDWPWQDLFFDIAEVIFAFLPGSKYEYLLRIVHENIRSSGYYFPSFIRNLFLLSPVEFRRSFVEEEIARGFFLWDIFANEDTETLNVIFRNVDAAVRVRLVSSERGLNLIFEKEHEWHAKEAFLRAAALSEQDKERLKESFTEYACGRTRRGRDSLDLLREEQEHREFYEFVETDASAGKMRKSEDDIDNGQKTLL